MTAMTDHDDRLFDASCYYYQLGDGVAWNAQIRHVVFKSQDSAQLFKRRYPEFDVWRLKTERELHNQRIK